jgi:hypothetical protein
MKDLVVRLSALDPDSGAAVRVIAYFDQLVDARAGLATIVRGAAPWMLATLHAVATSASLRAAATALRVHHSTLQDRIVHAERLLGWSVREPAGQFRLHLALVLRRLRHQPAG